MKSVEVSSRQPVTTFVPPIPHRIYEPNIIHNPLTWMGIWTPHGWRVHRKRFAKATRYSVRLDGDGVTTFFPEALKDPSTYAVTWADDLHLHDDPFTDGGIYPADPRVEYPPGRPRWAVSHTLLCYPHADHGLYTHEYTWDLSHGHLQTHFRRHVAVEPAVTDSRDGRTVTVAHRPISRTIEGNVPYPLCNSAVRGVWASPQKAGDNLYTTRETRLIGMLNGVYASVRNVPVVQCHGVWAVLPEDPLGDAFDPATGLCRDRSVLTGAMGVSLDLPKLGMFLPPAERVASRVYEGSISRPSAHRLPVPDALLDELRRRRGARFELGRVGYAAGGSFDGEAEGYGAAGYIPGLDLNDDGVIDDADDALLAPQLGKTVRVNLYHGAYFGGDWLSTAWCLEPEHRPGTPLIADYTFGGGYDAEAGVIRLLRTPGPGKPVWVEYHYDAPAEPGEGNIVVHLYRETPEVA
jgi:hypothetical protein